MYKKEKSEWTQKKKKNVTAVIVLGFCELSEHKKFTWIFFNGYCIYLRKGKFFKFLNFLDF